jgi:hypothetical protein
MFLYTLVAKSHLMTTGRLAHLVETESRSIASENSV